MIHQKFYLVRQRVFLCFDFVWDFGFVFSFVFSFLVAISRVEAN